MPKQPDLKRLIVCVDGARDWTDRTSGSANISNVSRIKSLALDGERINPDGYLVNQIVIYYTVAEAEPTPFMKVKGSGKIEDQIEAITKEICQILDSTRDEIFFYGSGRGAYVVRAVAGVLHHLGLVKAWSMVRFHELYRNALDLYKARRDDDSTKGLRIMQSLKVQCMEPPKIKFIGVFDTIKEYVETSPHDLTFNDSTKIFRQALALNENQYEHVGVSEFGEEPERSIVQAWFTGTNADICGGTQHDGLSLYPFQWMLLESIKAGLILRMPTNPNDNVLKLVFPHSTNNLPQIGDFEHAEWKTKYKNGVEVSMYDIHSTHAKVQTRHSCTHAVRLRESMGLYDNPRKIFSANGLVGWSSDAYRSVVIHPSVFCLLDRYPKVQENSRNKAIKKDLAEFRERALIMGDTLPPWLEGMQLQATGVKAFRILVCGKTGVGKSTLINKVFGVEMGDHDIDQAFESPSHPGLLIHDSRGWQAGSDQELELIAKFLRHRAFQKDPAEALHVIWFCVDSDVSRIEEADKLTFATIAQFSHQVPVFVVGTKKDKIVAYKKMRLLEQYMEKMGDYKAANELATREANKLAETQFHELLSQLSQIKHYKADGFCCLSKGDEIGIKDLLTQTLGLIADERVRLFCVAAQVVSVEQKINSAITESMRLATHAVRTAILPLPFSGIIGTPTVSRLLCEHVLQCFGFPKAAPEEVEDIMSRVVMGNLKSYMAVAVTQFIIIGGASIGLAVGTLGIGSVLGLSASIFAAAPAARMLFKCAADMILILERSFRYGGKYVSSKQIEDAAKYYTTATVKTFGGKEKLLQKRVHEEIERLIPLTNLTVAVRFAKLRVGLEDIIYDNRFEKPVTPRNELGSDRPRAELSSSRQLIELDGTPKPIEIGDAASIVELDGGDAANGSSRMLSPTLSSVISPIGSEMDSPPTYSSVSAESNSGQLDSRTPKTEPFPTPDMDLAMGRNTLQRGQTETLPSRWKSMTKIPTKFGRKKSKSIV